MVLPRIEERTLYEPIISYLKESGFQAIGNTMVFDKEPDVLFKYESLSFVIEVKIGKPDQIGVKAVAQAYDYSRKLGTQNIIIVIYPDQIRNEPISDYNFVSRIVLKSKVTVISLTEFWTESLVITLESFFIQLKENIKESRTKIDFATTVKLIERYVSDLNSVVYQIRTDELVSEVVNKLELFTSIGEIKDKETAKKQVVNLASFLLFNQLLFYYIYKKKTNSNNLPEFGEIKEIKDIQSYFDKITEIDYQSIYKVNLLGHIPNQNDVIEIINDITKAIKLLRAEYITHDLAGRFFHDLIPFEVRKVLAAFYTHPNAADLLASLAINSWDQTVIDPACGSGTLLVASYKRKLQLYESSNGLKDLNLVHKQFIENDLTGIDIMPFAAHISAINLTMQNIEEQTNTIRIATQDSLELASLLESRKFLNNGIIFNPYTTEIQKTLDEVGYAKTKKIKGTVSGRGRGSSFSLKPVDIVMMNPPFSDREKMPEEMRKKINNSPLSKICGNQVNLWGYFLALANYFLKPNGKIAAVIPINIARGEATKKIREFLLRNFKIDYIVRPLSDFAFSEGASFRDILLVATKKKPKSLDRTEVLFINDSIKSLSEGDFGRLTQMILTNSENSNSDFETRIITNETLQANKHNLMRILSQYSIEITEIIDSILQSEKVQLIESGKFSEGFHVSPKGISQLLFLTTPFTPDRVTRAFLIVDKILDDRVIVKVKGTDMEFDIPMKNLKPAFRTITGQSKMKISKTDYFVTRPFDDFIKIAQISKWNNKNSLNWRDIGNEALRKTSYLVIPERFNPYSVNTHLVAFYSEEPVIIPHTLRYGKELSKEESVFELLFLNSILFIAQMAIVKEETTGEYIHLMDSDLREMRYFNLEKLTKIDREILTRLYLKLSDQDFPSIMEQLSGKNPIRMELDTTILKVLGISDSKIMLILPRLYNLVLQEFQNMKNSFI